jgi:hypothetical protein
LSISTETEARILRHHHAERWRIGTVASQLGVHHGTVRRVLAQAGVPRTRIAPRPSRIDPYLSFIRETLAQFPTLTASRLYVMVKERGYPGRPDHFRHLPWLALDVLTPLMYCPPTISERRFVCHSLSSAIGCCAVAIRVRHRLGALLGARTMLAFLAKGGETFARW